jgi:hypothetical protein
MLSWNPAALTCFFDYLAPNKVFEYKAAHPEVPIIIRFQHPLQWQDNPAYYADQLGRMVASKWPEIQRLDPYVYFCNEMNLHYENGDNNPGNQYLYETPQFYQKYADWVRLTADVIKNITPNMKLVTPPFAFGHNEDGAPDDNGNPQLGWAGYDYLQETIKQYFDNILTFHAYWGHSGGSVPEWLYDPQLSTWYAFRWQRVLKLFETRYNIQAKMIIDEAGNFATSDLDFTDQLIYHAENCLNHSSVICITYFLWLDPTNSPGNLPNSWVQGCVNLTNHIERLKNMPNVPITEGPGQGGTTIRVLFEDGTVHVLELEDYLRAVVPSEVPALWPAEAVKAQAVAARSYAQYAIEHPRHDNADICTTQHCQVFNPAKIHPASDAAIQATKNIIARYNGATANGIFSANCGGHTLNNEDVWGGTPVPYLRGVPCPNKGQKNGHGVGLCQYGARDLANQGYTYDHIVKYFYTGVTLGLPTNVRTSSIYGTVVDHTGQPAQGVNLILTGQGYQIQATSATNGAYRFSEVPAGTYSLDLPDYQTKEENITTTPGQDVILNFTLPDPSGGGITMEITRGPGLPLIVGNWLYPGDRMKFTSPKGIVSETVAGSKLEYGAGGFEVYATETGLYILEVDVYRFEIPMSGQYTRLTFTETAPPPSTGAIDGTLRDHQSQAVANRMIYLQSNAVNLTDVTDEQGYFRFENLPDNAYHISVEDSAIDQVVTINGGNTVTLTLQLPAPPGGGHWEVDIERGPGLPLLVGDIGVAKEPIVVTDPKGFQTILTSGSKPEYGVGGFEIYAPLIGNYVLQFLGETFTIPMNGQFTKVTFRYVEGPEADQVQLVSAPMSRAEAEVIYKSLETHPATQGKFEIVDEICL